MKANGLHGGFTGHSVPTRYHRLLIGGFTGGHVSTLNRSAAWA